MEKVAYERPTLEVVSVGGDDVIVASDLSIDLGGATEGNPDEIL